MNESQALILIGQYWVVLATSLIFMTLVHDQIWVFLEGISHGFVFGRCENLYPKSTLQHGAKERQLELVKKVKTVTFCRPLFRRAVNIKMHHHTHRHMRMHWCARAEFVIQLRQGNPR